MLSAVPSFLINRTVAAGFSSKVHPQLAKWVPRVRALLTEASVGDVGQAWHDHATSSASVHDAVSKASATLVRPAATRVRCVHV